MKNRIITAAIGLSMIISLAACGNSSQNSQNSDSTSVVLEGGWEITQGSLAPADNPDAKEAFGFSGKEPLNEQKLIFHREKGGRPKSEPPFLNSL